MGSTRTFPSKFLSPQKHVAIQLFLWGSCRPAVKTPAQVPSRHFSVKSHVCNHGASAPCFQPAACKGALLLKTGLIKHGQQGGNWQVVAVTHAHTPPLNNDIA